MIITIDKHKCCGCGACEQRCPKHCITMQEDTEGFRYPLVDTALCIECGLCDKTCPMLHLGEPKLPIKVYAAKNINELNRLESSSGGIFIALASETIRKGGVVFGARFNEHFEVEHSYAETLEALLPLMRSKYMQSRIGNAYKHAKQILEDGRKVLFVGTGCQIAGLHRFLGKQYDNLLSIDIVCHGVPSKLVWERYLKDQSVDQINGINFRLKQTGGYTWSAYGLEILTPQASLTTEAMKTSFFRAYLLDLSMRPSCYACSAKDGRCSSDITLGDFWNIRNVNPEIDDDKGVSAVFAHTERGIKALEECKEHILSIESSFENATLLNSPYFRSKPLPPERIRFMHAIIELHKSIDDAIKYAFYVPLWRRVLSKIKKIILPHK